MSSNKSCNLLSEREVRGIVEKAVGDVRFRIGKYDIRPASDTPVGFLGDHFRVKVSLTMDDGTTRHVSYFVKSVPMSVPEHLDYAFRTRAFYKEIQLYKTLFVDMDKAMRSPTKWRPEYYYSRGDDVFVIEDLCAKGYRMPEERSLMDEERVRAALDAVAAMHAGSFVFEERYKRGEVKSLSPNRGGVALGDLYSHLTFETEASDEEGHPGNTYYQTGIASQVAVVDLLEGYTAEERVKIKEKLPDVLGRIFELVKPSEKHKNVFIHGDLWSNNLLFREDEDGRVRDAVIIDFQLARYAPPAHDVVMFLHMAQTVSFRKSKMDQLLAHYYESLSRELLKNDLSPDEVFPREEFLASCREYREFGIINSVLYFQLTMAPSDVTASFITSPELYHKIMLKDRSDLVRECFVRDEAFRSRMTESMNELISEYIL